MIKRKSFTAEFKREAVRLLENSKKQPSDLARELGVGRNQLYKWKEQLSRRGEKAFPGCGRRIAGNDEVSRSGYYDWDRRKESKRSQQDRVLLEEIRRIHQQTKEAYGATKSWRALNQSGTVCGKHRVARLRRQAGIEARRKRKFRLAYKALSAAPAP